MARRSDGGIPINRHQNLFLGFDEAGRGCVIGPLVMCAVLATRRQIGSLKSLGVKDSKQLSPAQRENMEDGIQGSIVGYGYSVLSAEVVGDERRNVNHLELEAMGQWIHQVSPKAVYVDVPARAGRGLENFCQSLAWVSGLSRSRILGANKADQRFPIVSAASILAKVHRDRLVQSLKHECGDFGSGYPSDPKTVAYLKALVAHPGQVVPHWVRAKWETYRQMVEKAHQPSLFQT